MHRQPQFIQSCIPKFAACPSTKEACSSSPTHPFHLSLIPSTLPLKSERKKALPGSMQFHTQRESLEKRLIPSLPYSNTRIKYCSYRRVDIHVSACTCRCTCEVVNYTFLSQCGCCRLKLLIVCTLSFYT